MITKNYSAVDNGEVSDTLEILGIDDHSTSQITGRIRISGSVNHSYSLYGEQGNGSRMYYGSTGVNTYMISFTLNLTASYREASTAGYLKLTASDPDGVYRSKYISTSW